MRTEYCAHVCTCGPAAVNGEIEVTFESPLSQSDTEIHQIVQATAVGNPEFGCGVWISGLVIQHDGLQVVIRVEAHQPRVLRSQLPAETKGAEVRFVIHPVTTERADRFVVAVQRDIAAIVKALQAHGQQAATNREGHESVSDMNGAVIFCLPGGAGKSWLAPMLATQLGIAYKNIIDEWRPGSDITPGALHVTNSRPTSIPTGVTVIYSLPGGSAC